MVESSDCPRHAVSRHYALHSQRPGRKKLSHRQGLDLESLGLRTYPGHLQKRLLQGRLTSHTLPTKILTPRQKKKTLLIFWRRCEIIRRFRSVGWHQKASAPVAFQRSLMSGPLESCSGRFSPLGGGRTLPTQTTRQEFGMDVEF